MEGALSNNSGRRRPEPKPWAFVRRRAPLIVIAALVAGTVALILGLFAPESYEAEATLLVEDQSIDSRISPQQVLEAENGFELGTGASLASLERVLDDTADELGVETPTQDSVELGRDESGGEESSNVLTLRYSDEDPELAAQFANALASNYIALQRAVDRQGLSEAMQQVEEDLAALPAGRRNGPEGKTLRQQARRLAAVRSLQTGNVRVVQEADVPSSPATGTAVGLIRNLIVGLVLGALGGAGLALVLDRLDPKVKDDDEVAHALGVPLLAKLPWGRSAPDLRQPIQLLPKSQARGFRLLRTRLQHLDGRIVRTVLVTSPSPGEGKSTTARYLASSAAESGTKTLLVEANFDRPSLASAMELAPQGDLFQLLSGRAPADEVVINRGSAEPNLDVVVGRGPVVGDGSETILERTGAQAAFNELTIGYDFVVIDTAPMTRVVEAIPLLTMVDATIVVARVGQTRFDSASDLAEQLADLGADVVGAVGFERRRLRESGSAGQAVHAPPSLAERMVSQ